MNTDEFPVYCIVLCFHVQFVIVKKKFVIIITEGQYGLVLH